MAHPIVGVWRVSVVGAPFPYHMFAFHSDGTMQQSNPPAGNKETSDTAGLGIWAEKDGAVKARFEEFRISFNDDQVTRGAVDFNLKVSANKLSGDCAFNIYDINGKHLQGPMQATVEADRVTLN
jgi:hypothetical protein